MENIVLNNKNRSELCRLMLNQKIQAAEITRTLRGDATIYKAALEYRIRHTYDMFLKALDVHDGFVIPADATLSTDVDIVPVLQTMIEIIENDVMDSNATLAFVTGAESVSKRLQQTSDKMLRSINVSVDVISASTAKDMPSCLSPDNLSPDPVNIPSDVMYNICPFTGQATDVAHRAAKDTAAAAASAAATSQRPQSTARVSSRRNKTHQFHITAPRAIVAPRTFVKADARYVRRCLSILGNDAESESLDESGKCALSQMRRLYTTCLTRVTQKRDICVEARNRVSMRLIELENVSRQAATWMDKRPVYTHRIIPQRALKTRDKLIKK